jgi:hypothetical protein
MVQFIKRRVEKFIVDTVVKANEKSEINVSISAINSRALREWISENSGLIRRLLR